MIYMALAFVLGIGVSYLVGAIPFAFIAGQLMGVDVRTVGSGNIGATNLARALGGGRRGTIAFVVTSLLDVSKGFLPAFFLGWWAADTTGGYPSSLVYFQVAFGAAAILGHVFPVYLGFHGGKAVNTSLGVALALAPLPALVAFVAWVIVFAIWRYVSLGSLVAAVVFPATLAALPWYTWKDDAPLYIFCFVVSALIIVRHKDNIKRLIAGTEKRIGSEAGSSEQKPQ